MGKQRKQEQKQQKKSGFQDKCGGKVKAKRSGRIDVGIDELEAILERARAALTEEEYEKIHGALETLLFLTQELEKKRVSVQRLKDMLFGAATEKTQKVLEEVLEASGTGQGASRDDESGSDSEGEKRKTKGHGRNGATDYTGGNKVQVSHRSLKQGDSCPECDKGTLYKWSPGSIVRIRGQAPLNATVYEIEKLRCNLCSKLFTAKAPAGVGVEKYDARSASMIALLKYGSGLPFNRLERLQGNLGIPLPASTQWEIVENLSRTIEPVYGELIRQAAQGEVLHNDDTTMRVLELMRQGSRSSDGSDRKGVFTSGIVSKIKEHRIALFFTGHKHAGENLVELLKRRCSKLGTPIQMCDALSRNMPDELRTIVANCLAHGRRKFVYVAANFPEQCLHVLNILKQVYKNDDVARNERMSAEQQLGFHKAMSGPLMADLKTWLAKQIDDRLVEPNSGLGEAIAYMRNHWDELTLFLRQPGAPLDNNVCERALKKAILHRKNAYYFKTENGARVGDLFMTLIHTCELNTVNPFDYLTELHNHSARIRSIPELWMPWNYRNSLAATASPDRGLPN
jgi:transposase